jgi:hypothetical protein
MKQTIAITVAVLALLGSGYWLVKSNSQIRVDPKIAEFNLRANKLIEGLQQYKEFFKHYPTGTTAEISKALSGQAEGAAGKVIILATASADKNDKGEIVDPWGTALQFYFSHNSVLIRSAGPNKVFEDSRTASDDLFRTDTK